MFLSVHRKQLCFLFVCLFFASSRHMEGTLRSGVGCPQVKQKLNQLCLKILNLKTLFKNGIKKMEEGSLARENMPEN